MANNYISIVMPAYNAEKTIEDSIKSVINQSYSDFELIIIDDCSTDSTSRIIERIAKEDSRIAFYKNPKNSGVSNTRNRAISLAKGEWIAFLDSDDLWAKNKLEKQLTFIRNIPDAVLSYTSSRFIDADNKIYSFEMHAKYKIAFKELLKRNLISCSSVIVKADVIKNIKMPGDYMHEDYYTWLTLLKKYKFAYGLDLPLLTYRLSNNSKSSSRFKSAVMIFRTYEAIGFNKIVSFGFTLFYSIHSFSKRIHFLFSDKS